MVNIRLNLVGPDEDDRRGREWAMKRERALQLKHADPELTVTDIARRLGVRRQSVAVWLRAPGLGQP